MTPTSAAEEFDNLVSLKKRLSRKLVSIKHAVNASGISKSEIAERAGMSQTTFRRRMRNPFDLTLNEVVMICNAINREDLVKMYV